MHISLPIQPLSVPGLQQAQYSHVRGIQPVFGGDDHYSPMLGKATIYEQATGKPVEARIYNPYRGHFDLTVQGEKVGHIEIIRKDRSLLGLPWTRRRQIYIQYMQGKYDPQSHQYKKIGTALHQLALEISQREGCPGHITLTSLPESVQFHTRLGFKPDCLSSFLDFGCATMFLNQAYAREKLVEIAKTQTEILLPNARYELKPA